ncbi:hypothetical protein HK100_005250, partial [Physocladia obscura]
NADLLDKAISLKVKAYFQDDSPLVIDNETCLEDYQSALVTAVSTLVHIVKEIAAHKNQRWLLRAKNAQFGNSISERDNLEYAFRAITSLDPIHFTFNFSKISGLFLVDKAREFWKSHRYRIFVESSELVDAILKAIDLNDDDAETSATNTTMRENLMDSIDKNRDGLIHVEEFASWFKKSDLKECVQETFQTFKNRNMEEQVFNNSMFLSKWGASNCAVDVQGLLNERVEGTRTWTLEMYRDWLLLEDSKILVLIASAGFGKSVISAMICDSSFQTNEYRLFYFFKVDDKINRQLQGFLRTIAAQICLKLNLRANESSSLLQQFAFSLEEGPLSAAKVLADLLAKNSNTFQVLVVDALDECPAKDRTALASVINLFSKEIKVVVTSRPNFNPFKNQASCTITQNLENPEFIAHNTRDLMIYIEKTLDEVSDRGCQLLVESSRHNFLWIKLAVNIIRDGQHEARTKYLVHNLFKPDLEAQYLLNFSHLDTMPKQLQVQTKFILGMVLTFQEPLTKGEINYIWESVKLQTVQGASRLRFNQFFAYLMYRLLIRTASNGVVMAGHKSLRDSVTSDKLRPYVDADAAHIAIANASFDALLSINQHLIQTMKVIPSNSTLRKSSPKEYFYQYAAKYWFIHIKNLGYKQRTVAKFRVKILHMFKSDACIHWIAFLAKIGSIKVATDCLIFLGRNLAFSDLELIPTFVYLRSVCERFADMLFHHPLEIYHSVAAMCLSLRELKPIFSKAVAAANNTPNIIYGSDEFWNAEDLMLKSGDLKQKLFQSKLERNIIIVGRNCYRLSTTYPSDQALFYIWDLFSPNLSIAKIPNFDALGKDLYDFDVLEFDYDNEIHRFIFAIYENSKMLHFFNTFDGTHKSWKLDHQPYSVNFIQTLNLETWKLVVTTERGIYSFELQTPFAMISEIFLNPECLYSVKKSTLILKSAVCSHSGSMFLGVSISAAPWFELYDLGEHYKVDVNLPAKIQDFTLAFVDGELHVIFVEPGKAASKFSRFQSSEIVNVSVIDFPLKQYDLKFDSAVDKECHMTVVSSGYAMSLHKSIFFLYDMIKQEAILTIAQDIPDAVNDPIGICSAKIIAPKHLPNQVFLVATGRKNTWFYRTYIFDLKNRKMASIWERPYDTLQSETFATVSVSASADSNELFQLGPGSDLLVWNLDRLLYTLNSSNKWESFDGNLNPVPSDRFQQITTIAATVDNFWVGLSHEQQIEYTIKLGNFEVKNTKPRGYLPGRFVDDYWVPKIDTSLYQIKQDENNSKFELFCQKMSELVKIHPSSNEFHPIVCTDDDDIFLVITVHGELARVAVGTLFVPEFRLPTAVSTKTIKKIFSSGNLAILHIGSMIMAIDLGSFGKPLPLPPVEE